MKKKPYSVSTDLNKDHVVAIDFHPELSRSITILSREKEADGYSPKYLLHAYDSDGNWSLDERFDSSEGKHDYRVKTDLESLERLYSEIEARIGNNQ